MGQAIFYKKLSAKKDQYPHTWKYADFGISTRSISFAFLPQREKAKVNFRCRAKISADLNFPNPNFLFKLQASGQNFNPTKNKVDHFFPIMPIIPKIFLPINKGTNPRNPKRGQRGCVISPLGDDAGPVSWAASAVCCGHIKHLHPHSEPYWSGG